MWQTVQERWTSLEPGQRKSLGILGGALTLTLLGSFFLVRSHGAMSPLYSGLPPTEMREIAAELSRQGIEYTITEDEASISVPSRLEARARMRLAAAGLPRTSPEKGWEIFGEGGLAVTKPQQAAMQIRALQGELSRSIASLEDVSKAAVHISLKQDSPFLSEAESAKAAVLLHLKPGAQIDREEAMAIAFLVAKSVPDLETAQITIMDEKGALLFSDNIAHGTGDQGATDVEREIERRVQSQLDLTFGLGKAIVRATAQMETERAEVRRTTYTPVEGQREGIPGRELVENEQFDGAGAAGQVGGVPGVGGNLFDEQQNQGGGAQQGGSYTRNKQERDFKVNEQQELLVKPGGGVQRLTVGIFVDESLNTELTKIETVARNAAGIDEKRGDSVSVEAVKFQGANLDNFASTSRAEMVKTIARLILNALALIIGLLTLRSIIAALKPAPDLPAGAYAETGPTLTGQSEVVPMLTGNNAPGGGAVASLSGQAGGLTGLPAAGAVPGAGALYNAQDTVLDDLEPVLTGPTPEELIQRVDNAQVDDVAEVLRHWLEGDLDES